MQEYHKLDGQFDNFQDEFAVPTKASIGVDRGSKEKCLYMCGNSLGLMPKIVRNAVDRELTVWSERAVVGHFDHPSGLPWVRISELTNELLVPILGAQDLLEVAAMGSLTSNLHAMMATFYRPNETRFKIIVEAKAFPSDRYALQSQAVLHGLDPSTTVVALEPRAGEFCLRTEDIIKSIEEQGPQLALVMLSGIQFYTGQLFDIPRITAAGQAAGAVVGWDLAHAVGNVPLRLHDWGVDFAVFCSYKYLNAGPGGIGGIFVHSKYAKHTGLQRQAGWWGNSLKTRFDMADEFSPCDGAAGFQVSNLSVLDVVCLESSLQIFQRAGGVAKLRAKSFSLTGYLEMLLKKSCFYVDVDEARDRESKAFTIITPQNPESRGAQLSLLFLPIGSGLMQKVFDIISHNGLITDERKPDVIRVAPAPLYNTHEEVFKSVQLLLKAIESAPLSLNS